MQSNSISVLAAMGMNTCNAGSDFDKQKLNDPNEYKGKGFSGGNSQMREFTIKGIKIMATDLTMAKKKYAKLKK
jgi:hypothetical protein